MTVGELDPTDQQDLELARAVGSRDWEKGGSEAFWKLWEKHREWVWLSVWRASRQMCPPFVERGVFAEALLERVMTRLMRKVQRYEGRAPFKAFVKRLIVNAAVDQGRHYDARREAIRGGFSHEQADTDSDDTTRVGPAPEYRVKTFPSPERLALARERNEKVYEALRLVVSVSKTSVNWAAALRLRYLEGVQGHELARALGCSLQTAQKHLSRGRKAMRDILRKEFGVEKLEDLFA
jgi:RNA polymerase sigma factor (sigma-70 family)